MPKRSAGILLYRRVAESELEVLLVHPGGPLWAKKDVGAWSIPKGEYDADENPEAAAVRELEEETGLKISGELVTLGEIKQLSGKIVTAFACEGGFDTTNLRSNTFTLHGREYPEVDRAEWFSIAEARAKILPAQAEFLDRLRKRIS